MRQSAFVVGKITKSYEKSLIKGSGIVDKGPK